MVELDVVYHDQLGEIVEEFRALIEKGGVVFISLNDEMPGVGRIPETGTLAKICGQTADQIGGVQARMLHDPGRNRCRGGLSVGSGDNDIVATTEEMGTKHFGQRNVVQLAVEHCLDLGIATRDGVADNDKRLLLGKILRTEAGTDFDPARSEEVAHRRIGLVV